MQVHPAEFPTARKKSSSKSTSKVVQLGLIPLASIFDVRATGEIQRHIGERLVHGKKKKPVAANSFFFRQALFSRAAPRASPMSSTKWCASIFVSPEAFKVKSIKLCLENSSSMWSKKGSVVGRCTSPDHPDNFQGHIGFLCHAMQSRLSIFHDLTPDRIRTDSAWCTKPLGLGQLIHRFPIFPDGRRRGFHHSRPF